MFTSANKLTSIKQRFDDTESVARDSECYDEIMKYSKAAIRLVIVCVLTLTFAMATAVTANSGFAFVTLVLGFAMFFFVHAYSKNS